MQKRPPHHFLHFTRKEKNGTLLLLIIISLLIATPFIYTLIFKEKNIDPGSFKNEMASLAIKPADSIEKTYNKTYGGYNDNKLHPAYELNEHTNVATLFYFDPNTLQEAGWKKLGVKEKTIATIQNYLSKGGRFKQPDDIKKIWGLHDEQVAQLLPYICIEQSAMIPSSNFREDLKGEYPKKILAAFDINNADSVEFVSLPGIGPGFARRILAFRNKLGGFYKTEQVSETFGLADSTFQKIKNYLQVSRENIKKININTATADELKGHPYIRYQLANAIIQYRTQHGNFAAVDDIKKIMLVTEELFQKLAPYLAVH